jgi:hypothetical protein
LRLSGLGGGKFQINRVARRQKPALRLVCQQQILHAAAEVHVIAAGASEKWCSRARLEFKRAIKKFRGPLWVWDHGNSPNLLTVASCDRKTAHRG